MNARQKKIAVGLGIAASVVGFGSLLYLIARPKQSSNGNLPPAPPLSHLPPGDSGSSGGGGIPMGKPGVTTGPGPFDPVSSDWKRQNAPDWWPW